MSQHFTIGDRVTVHAPVNPDLHGRHGVVKHSNFSEFLRATVYSVELDGGNPPEGAWTSFLPKNLQPETSTPVTAPRTPTGHHISVGAHVTVYGTGSSADGKLGTVRDRSNAAPNAWVVRYDHDGSIMTVPDRNLTPAPPPNSTTPPPIADTVASLFDYAEHCGWQTTHDPGSALPPGTSVWRIRGVSTYSDITLRWDSGDISDGHCNIVGAPRYIAHINPSLDQANRFEQVRTWLRKGAEAHRTVPEHRHAVGDTVRVDLPGDTRHRERGVVVSRYSTPIGYLIEFEDGRKLGYTDDAVNAVVRTRVEVGDEVLYFGNGPGSSGLRGVVRGHNTSGGDRYAYSVELHGSADPGTGTPIMVYAAPGDVARWFESDQDTPQPPAPPTQIIYRGHSS